MSPPPLLPALVDKLLKGFKPAGENVQVECPLEGKQGYSLYPRLRYIHEVSLQHGKPMDDKPLLARRSEAVKNMSKELSTLFEANGLEPYRCIVKEGHTMEAYQQEVATMRQKAERQFSKYEKMMMYSSDGLRRVAEYALEGPYKRPPQLTQEHMLRWAEVGPQLTFMHVDLLLRTAGSSSFHPLFPLPASTLQSERGRISRIANPKLRQQQEKTLTKVLSQREAALKVHKENGNNNFAADFKAGTLAIKALVGVYAVFLAASDLEHEQDCWEDLKETQEHLGCYSLLDPAWHPNLVSAALRCTQLRQDEGDTMLYHARHLASPAAQRSRQSGKQQAALGKVLDAIDHERLLVKEMKRKQRRFYVVESGNSQG